MFLFFCIAVAVVFTAVNINVNNIDVEEIVKKKFTFIK